MPLVPVHVLPVMIIKNTKIFCENIISKYLQQSLELIPRDIIQSILYLFKYANSPKSYFYFITMNTCVTMAILTQYSFSNFARNLKISCMKVLHAHISRTAPFRSITPQAGLVSIAYYAQKYIYIILGRFIFTIL